MILPLATPVSRSRPGGRYAPSTVVRGVGRRKDGVQWVTFPGVDQCSVPYTWGWDDPPLDDGCRQTASTHTAPKRTISSENSIFLGRSLFPYLGPFPVGEGYPCHTSARPLAKSSGSAPGILRCLHSWDIVGRTRMMGRASGP